MQQPALKVNKFSLVPLIFTLFINFNFGYCTNNFHILEPGRAYRSGQPVNLAHLIETYQIRTVFNLRGEAPGEWWWENERRTCERMDVEWVNIRMSAYRLPEPAVLLRLYDALTAAQHPILIHCEGGSNRTGAVSALWRLMQGEARERAMDELSERYFHNKRLYPAMDRLVEIFVPEREWVVEEYPRFYSS